MLLSLFATGGSSRKLASGAVCRGHNRAAQVPSAKVWLHGVAGFLAVAAGALPGLLSDEGGSLAGAGEPSEGGRQ